MVISTSYLHGKEKKILSKKPFKKEVKITADTGDRRQNRGFYARSGLLLLRET